MPRPTTVSFHETAAKDEPNTLLRIGPNKLLACRTSAMSIRDLREVVWLMQGVIDEQEHELNQLHATMNQHYENGCDMEYDGPADEF